MEDLLSQEDLQKILQKRLGTSDFQILQTSYGRISDKIEGFLGEHFILDLKILHQDLEKTESFFVKTVPISNPSQRRLVEKVFGGKEAFMYEKVFPQLEEAGFSVGFIPKCYLIKGDLIVMENLKVQKYEMVPRNTFLNMEEIKAALESLAEFHASCIAFEETKSMELGRPWRFEEVPKASEGLREVFFVYKDPEGYAEKYHWCGKKCLAGLAKHFQWSSERKKAFEEKVLGFNYVGLYETELPYRKTCAHGDLWINNMLFKKTDSKILCKLVDYQICRYSHPSLDSLLVIYTCSSRKFRKVYKNQLLEIHYLKMEEILNSYGFDLQNILSKEDYLRSAEFFEPLACFQAVRNKTLTHLPLDIINQICTNGIDFEELIFSDLRVEMVSQAFLDCEEFRKILTDDVYDLEEILPKSLFRRLI